MRIKKKGFSLVELMVSMSILSIVIVSVAVYQTTNYKGIQKAKDKTFATQKVIQMLDEMRRLVDGGNETDVLKLDDIDDHSIRNYVLTTESFPSSITSVDLKAPNGISGNSKPANYWKFSRKIKIERRSDDERARNVYVAVYYTNPKYTVDPSNPSYDKENDVIQPPLAFLTGVLKTSGQKNLPSEVFDTYLLAFDNMSGWWSDPQPMKLVYEDLVAQLRTVNPGMDLRLHKITNLCYGKDPFYAPYSTYKFNTNNSTYPIKYPYFYPGKIANDLHSAQEEEYYGVTNLYKGGARLRLDTSDAGNADSLVNAWYSDNDDIPGNLLSTNADLVGTSYGFNKRAFSVADMYSHGLRWPEEINNYNRLNDFAKTTAKSDGDSIKDDRSIELEPTYRILLEQMKSTNRYKNAMIMDLHGETFPTLPIRNYSDAAKDPSNTQVAKSSALAALGSATNNINKRVVTHPENIEYRRVVTTPTVEKAVYNGNIPPIKLRVYPYVTQDVVNLSKTTYPQYNQIDRISVFIPTDGKVGAKASGTETGTAFATDSNFPVISDPPAVGIPAIYGASNNLDVLDRIKEKLAITYINAGEASYTGLSSNPDRIGGNVVGTIKVWASGAAAATPVFVRAGTLIEIYFKVSSSPLVTRPYKFRVTRDTKIIGGTNLTAAPIPVSSVDYIPVADNTLVSTAANIYSITVVANTTNSGRTTNNNIIHNNAYVASTITIATPITDGITTILKRTSDFDLIDSNLTTPGLYTVEVNPAFDRDGTGARTVNSGILITLYNSKSKHNFGSTTRGLNTGKRLYGMEYIPTPLGYNMPNIGTVNYNYTGTASTLTNVKKPVSSGNQTATSIKGYESFWGRDLDDDIGGQNDDGAGTMDSTAYTRNTARWVISLDVNGSTTKSDSDYNPFAAFRGKAVPVETRIGKNLNSGMTVNQTINAYDGEVADFGSFTPNTSIYGGGSNLIWRLNKTNPGTISAAPTEDKVKALKLLPNLSRTYVWVNDGATYTSSVLPHTEKYQLMGDPRHNPYLDVLQDRGFNIHFSTISSAVTSANLVNNDQNNYPMFQANSIYSYEGNSSDVDIFRFMKVFRESMANSAAIWNSLTGFSSWMFAVGGDIVTNGTDFNDQNFTILNNSTSGPYESSAFPTTGGQIMPNQAFSDSQSQSLKIVSKTNLDWVALPWLGEIYPDDQFFVSGDGYGVNGSSVNWYSEGNLNGTSYKRYNMNNKKFNYINATSNTNTTTNITDRTGRLLNDRGCSLFFNEANGGTRDTKTFAHYTFTETHTISSVAGALGLAAGYNVSMQADFLVTRAFSIDNVNSNLSQTPNGWNDEVNTSVSTQTSLLNGANGSFLSGGTPVTDPDNANNVFYYFTGKHIGSAIVRVDLPYLATAYPANPSVFYVLMNGLASASGNSATGKAPVAKMSIVGTIHSFLSLADINKLSDPDSTAEEKRVKRARVTQVPLVQFTSSDNPRTTLKGDTPKEGVEINKNAVSYINLDWITSWQKWSATYDNFSKNTNYYPDSVDPLNSAKKVNTWKENDVDVVYQLMYSKDRGKNWFFLYDSGSGVMKTTTVQAFPGRYVGLDPNPVINSPNSTYIITCDTNCYTNTSTGITAARPGVVLKRTWNISNLPEGQYLFRVEAYRRSDTDASGTVRQQHYSYHQRELYLREE